MKFLKALLIAIVVIVGGYFIVGLLIPKEYDFVKTAEFSQSPKEVYELVNDLNNYQKWNAWGQMETECAQQLDGTGAEIGDVYSWEGDTIGQGSLTKEEMTPYTFISNKLQFFKPFEAISYDVWEFEELENGGTKVTWHNKGETPIFMRPLRDMMNDKMMGPAFDTSFENIGKWLDAKPSIAVNRETLPQTYYIAIKDSCNEAEIPAKMTELYGALMEYVANNDIEVTGVPFSFWNKPVDGFYVFEAAMPVNKMAKGNKTVRAGDMPAHEALTVVHEGPYEEVEPSHDAIHQFAAANGISIPDLAMEWYLNDSDEVGMDKALTKVSYAIQ